MLGNYVFDTTKLFKGLKQNTATRNRIFIFKFQQNLQITMWNQGPLLSMVLILKTAELHLAL